MNFDNITIILCRTSHPGNIGSTARAMQTMGFKKLCLVGPKIFPSAEATALAANAKEVLDNTKMCQDMEAALVNQHFVIGFTARKRELTQPHVNLKDLPGEIVKLKEKQNIAILFGNISIVKKGKIDPSYNEVEVAVYMKNKNIEINIKIGTGKKSFTAYSMDLTKKYIEINADYRT